MNTNNENTMDTMDTMNNAQWITDRKPMAKDADYEKMVWYSDGKVTYRVEWTDIISGDAWMPIDVPSVYVKPKRYLAAWDDNEQYWMIRRDGRWFELLMRLNKQSDEHRMTAERIAEVYEEMMP